MNEISQIIQQEKKKVKGEKDQNSPFSGNLKLRGRTFVGFVVSKDTHRTARVEWTIRKYLKKYERFRIKRTKVAAHNPENINADVGDLVMIAECRPLSKTKKFVIIKKLAHSKKYMVKRESIDDDKKAVQEALKKENLLSAERPGVLDNGDKRLGKKNNAAKGQDEGA